MPRLHPEVLLVSRYGLVGLVTTAVGGAVILALDLGLHAMPALANLGGYAVGMAVGFVLNRTFVFRHRAAALVTGPRYAVAVASGFLLNQAVLQLAAHLLGGGGLQHALAQLAAMASYTVAVFLICRWWVFAEPRR